MFADIPIATDPVPKMVEVLTARIVLNEPDIRAMLARGHSQAFVTMEVKYRIRTGNKIFHWDQLLWESCGDDVDGSIWLSACTRCRIALEHKFGITIRLIRNWIKLTHMSYLSIVGIRIMRRPFSVQSLNAVPEEQSATSLHYESDE